MFVAVYVYFGLGQPRDDHQGFSRDVHELWIILSKVPPRVCNVLIILTYHSFFLLPSVSASAAGQAITSFIRNHTQRCDLEQDQPLLLKHTLSGTPSDDDLVAALYSRSGGAHCALNDTEQRVTNFRRGTVIWYLSRAAGAPCPFARAGIRLCDYKYTGDTKFEDQQCGHKRKRFLRPRAGDNDGSDSDDLPSDSERRPPKVKLLLRLKPRVSPPSTDATPDPGPPLALSKSVNDGPKPHASPVHKGELRAARPDEPIFPPYPRPSLSIPVYTPSLEDIYPELFTPVTPIPVHRRSSSITHSVASPPPDSDDDDYDPMDRLCRRQSGSNLRRSDDDDFDSGFDTDLDLEFEGDARDESPGPRSPSVPEDDGVVIKVEPSDSGLLGNWDGQNCSSKIGKSSTVTPSSTYPKEEPDLWNWDGFNGFSIHDPSQTPASPEAFLIKHEDTDSPARYLDDDDDDDITLLGPLSAVEPSSSVYLPSLLEERKQSANIWKDVELLGPDSLRLQDFDEGDWPNVRVSPHRPRAHTIPNFHALAPLHSKSEPILPRPSLPELDLNPDR